VLAQQSLPDERISLGEDAADHRASTSAIRCPAPDAGATRTIVRVQRTAATTQAGSNAATTSGPVPDCTGAGSPGRLRSHQPSVTIRTEFMKPEKGRYLHPTENRPITHAEAALQAFPPDFQWCGSKVAIARQIGNAVPVLLARELGRAIARMYA
jgi:DNA (cytosine-5)-methyltransferase 1